MPSALAATGSTRAWRRIRATVLTRDHHRCQIRYDDGTICGAPATHAGHVTARHHWPTGQPGIDNPDNLRAECAHHSASAGTTIRHHHTPAPSRWYTTPTLTLETRALHAVHAITPAQPPVFFTPPTGGTALTVRIPPQGAGSGLGAGQDAADDPNSARIGGDSRWFCDDRRR